MKRISIGIVGDFDEKILTLAALNQAIDHCRKFPDFAIDATWCPTTVSPEVYFKENRFQGLWIAPGSPYQDDANVFETIQIARTTNFPLLGSCGGFQYMVLEYARSVMGFATASHAESDPHGLNPFISPLACSLKGREEDVIITDNDSWLRRTLRCEKITGHFYCSYGVAPEVHEKLNKFPFVFTAFSPHGEARALELKGHRFFNGTLFQPSLDSTEQKPNPLILDFFATCARDEKY